MGLFSRKKQQPVQQEERAYTIGGLNFNSLTTFSNEKSLNLSAFYCGVNQISNSVALLPINIVEYKGNEKKEIVNHPLNNLLNLKPNARYTHFDFFKLLIESVIIRGNGYALIDRDEKTLLPKQLIYLDSNYVTPMPQTDGTVKYVVSGIDKAIDAINMIDLHMHLDSQFRGISLIKYAWLTLKGASDAEQHAENFFKSGANLSGVLKASAPLTNEQKKQIGESWRNTFQNGSSDKVSVAVLPQGVDYQSVSMNPSDSQLLQSREFNVIEIARFLCIPPSKLMVMDDVSYNSLEMAQISYLQDTILPYTQMIEDEFNAKIFRPSQVGKIAIDFDYSTMLSTNKETEANYYKTLLVNGILSLNEVRNKLGFGNIEGGEEHFMQISYGTMSNIINGAYVKPQDQSQSNQIDNKVKGAEKENEETKTEE